MNQDEWENSTCTCRDWHKTLKCNHIIALASRLKKCSFAAIAYSIPLTVKRRRGKPASTKPALQRQPNELIESIGIDECISIEKPIAKNPVGRPK